MKSYDVIVVGTGGIGSAALWRLARRGGRVAGIDARHPPHDRGSTHGQTRMIRQAYYEHPDYVPLVQASYRLWSELEAERGDRFYQETGLIGVGRPEGEIVSGVLASARQHKLDVTEMTAKEIEGKWHGLRVPEGAVGVFERRAGFLYVERCVTAMLDAACASGAELFLGTTTHGWTCGDDLIVHTSQGDLAAKSLVVTAGPWAGRLLPEFAPQLEVRRKTLHWFASEPGAHLADGFPCFMYDMPAGIFYGFPAIDARGIKAAEHTGGTIVDDPDRVDRLVVDADWGPTERFTRQCLPAAGRRGDSATCMYTLSPDKDFIVGRHPTEPRICLAAGLSGHGYKFAAVLGELLADMALLDGSAPIESTLPKISFLSPTRFA